jgi:ATP-binding cassette subfamily F protein uup
MIARALARPSNLLVLDEPTNDLDLETLDLLQEMLGEYPGTVLLVSHDRDFLDRAVGSVLVFEGEGRWTEYAGGYTDMVAQRGAGVTARTELTAPRSRGASQRSSPASAAARRKLGFKEQHELGALPERMAALQARIGKLQSALADPHLYARDQAGFARLSAALGEAQAELGGAEERWLELEMLREELSS